MLETLYVRQALADFTAFASIPFAFWGLYRYARSGRYRFLLAGALAVALLLLSSNTIALIAVPALLVWVAWLGWRERSRRVLLRGLACVALGLTLSAFFWLPALAERGLVQTARGAGVPELPQPPRLPHPVCRFPLGLRPIGRRPRRWHELHAGAGASDRSRRCFGIAVADGKRKHAADPGSFSSWYCWPSPSFSPALFRSLFGTGCLSYNTCSSLGAS